MPMRDKLIDLWKSSTIIQGALALMFGGTICYLAISGREAPEVLFALVGIIIGYYFRTKTNQST